jgi:hypothetical protein
MAMKQIGPVTKAWYKWKALRLPWRKRFLMGSFYYHLPLQPHYFHLHTYQASISKATHTGSFDSHAVPRVTSVGDELFNTRHQRITHL